ncbi:zinc finger, CCHC-type containing protein [Tanacetum coccineum]|uniref:Zinc finger, CCHC-type containing protein n=1 Tax=Tanacetum coccineum TaxID=301880 RepID=A0ABQ5HW21_9ASTR
MDVKTAFFNGDLEEKEYMKQPRGFVMPGNEHKVYKVIKSLYGLKQAPKQWHQKFDEVVLAIGFIIKQSDTYSSSTSGWVFFLGGGAISWSSKKQTCINSSTMEYEFVALAAVGKEAEWLRNLIHEIPIWPKPITPISINCDNPTTLARAYSLRYNGKSRHLGVRHSMIRELIMNGVISIKFVRS